MSGTASLRIGIDTGGTFTDIVCVDDKSGAMRVTKVASTPSNPAVALVRGVQAILGQCGAGVDDLAVLAHGTTVATNALLQDEIAGLGLIVTEGFRHILEIARQSVPEGYGNSYFWVKPERLVPLRYVREVGGRLDFLGAELRPLDEASVRAAARFFRAQGIATIGICLMHSYANAAHERRTAEIVAQEYPGCTLSLSSDVLPEYREYERAVTTLVDAFIKPHMSRYLDRIRDELGQELNEKPFLVMQSSGGVASPDQVMRKPITTALSGPAAGALGSAVIAEIAGFPDLVTLDAGGTSTDLCLIEGAKPKITNGGRVGRFPVRIPMLDVKTIGTGGGSIAWLSREGKLKVGPRSAGAVPGPMCYPNGGEEPTITDANLVLGRIPPALIGGGIRLDVLRARQGLERLAARLPGKLNAEQLAEGIIEIANWDQANAIRQMTIQRGIDPGAFALLSFGGSGPAQSPAVMELMGMRTCIVPPNPGNLSAFGLLAVDWRTDHIVTKVMPEDAIDLSVIAAHYATLEKDAAATLAEGRHRARADRARARGRRPLRGTVHGSSRAGAFRRGRRAIPRRADRGLPRRASQNLRLQLRRPAEGGAGQFLRVRFRHDRPAEHPRVERNRRAAEARQPAGLLRRQVLRHAGVRARFARCRLQARRAGRGRRVRLDHRRLSGPASARRSARHPDHPRRRQHC